MSKMTKLARLLSLMVASFSVVMSGFLVAPVHADDGNGTNGSDSGVSDDRGLGTPPSKSGSKNEAANLAAGDAWVYRVHPTANHEKVDLRADRISKVKTQHNVNFDALVRVVQSARSPRKSTSPDGIDRGVYQYRIYEYKLVNGAPVPTGKWVVVQAIIEWGDGIANRGWLVTAYPVSTHTGLPAQVNGKSWMPSWVTTTGVFGPPNNDILY